jgi:uncharacterized protein (DUF2235 family)
MDIPVTASVTPAINCHAQALLDRDLPRPNAKKIFVFCDGTGNKFEDQCGSKDGNSNVVKLYSTLRVADNQVAYYHPGVGTMGDPTIRLRIFRWWSMVKGLAFGTGFQEHVLDAYRYLMEIYNDGDEIYLFGFSRGAYTARAVAGLLHGYGLLCRGNEGHIIYAWNAFHDELKRTRKLATKKREDKTAQSITRSFAFSETYSRTVTFASWVCGTQFHRWAGFTVQYDYWTWRGTRSFGSAAMQSASTRGAPSIATIFGARRSPPMTKSGRTRRLTRT